ncbi:MAG: RipA family octameric membrane protein [Gammaproteobacteria bacterium]
MTEEERDYEAYKSYVQLWKDENPIKTNKLQVLLIVNGLLVSALQVAGGFEPKNWFLFLAGAVFSFIWVLSIGRTSLFQKVWQIKANEISGKYPNDQRFFILNTAEAKKKSPAWLQVLGSVSSKYYLLGAPLLFSFLWLVSLLYVCVY